MQNDIKSPYPEHSMKNKLEELEYGFIYQASNYKIILDNEKRLLELISSKNIKIMIKQDKYIYYNENTGDFLEGNKDKIEISLSRDLSIKIKIVNCLERVINKKEYDDFYNIIFLSKAKIPLLFGDCFNTKSKERFIKDLNGNYLENICKYNNFLAKRLDNNLPQITEYKSFVFKFLSSITTKIDTRYLVSWLGKIFVNLKGIDALILIGNKNISKDIFWDKIISPIFGKNCISITEEVLQNCNKEEIVFNYLFFHIDFIPTKMEDMQKLKDIVFLILSKQHYHKIEGARFSGQIFITLEEPHIFIKELMSFYSIFFVDNIENIKSRLNIENELGIYKGIADDLDLFSTELCYLGREDISLNTIENSNNEFIEWIEDFDSTPNNSSFDILNIQNLYNVIPSEERDKHTYITGQSGSGKSELLKTLILSDIKNNDSSIILIEPHGDLSTQIAKNVEDKTRLIYIDLMLNNEKTPTINPFDIEDKSKKNIDQISKMIMSILKDINDDDRFSGAMSDMLENCIPVLLRKGDSSFIELYRFMNDKRNKDLIELGKKSINYLEREYFEDKFSEPSLSATKDAVSRRLRKLVNDEQFSDLMNGKNTINLEQLMNTKGKIIIFRILKSDMLDSYKYYARFIIGLIQIFALKRANLEELDRVHTHLYVDEFHNFITPSIEEILTESRKYKLFLTLAHQSVSQLKDSNLGDIILSNTNVKLIGKNSNKTLDALNKNINEKLTNVENLNVGEFYIKAGNQPLIKIKNSDEYLKDANSISNEKWSEIKEYQLQNFYRDIKEKEDLNVSEDNLLEMIEIFKADISSKNITESSCLYKIQKEDPKRFDEIKSDFEYIDKNKNLKPRIRKQELNEVFALSFGIKNFMNNREFIQLLKNETDISCIFNKDFSDSRSGKFTSDGKVKTEQYYLINVNN
ncbi:type IV secretory system conjugative DNA transfer family protein [Aliarcobacter lanthieri]|uniref:type IV secretory system conjugative DNA transfer family protein n=1 Tax=Aliarcobacter lanthieri TaxID=1355374 RepID=UPI003AAB152B